MKSHANSFVAFLKKVVPIEYRQDKQLVSHDVKSSLYNYKYTYSVKISSICREDLIFLPSNVAKEQYWRSGFRSALTSRQLVKYLVFDVEEPPVCGEKYALSYVQIARESDIGNNDKMCYVQTHLGHILKPGDEALGYDVYGANVNDDEMEKCCLSGGLPEVERERKKGKARAFRTKKLPMEMDESREENKDYDQESENASMTDGEGAPTVPIEELLAELELSDEEVESNGEEEYMNE
ncbi:unnamed protein product [Eruca vesicaria subsp. sativa]|uniref:60S ribosomal export protein NMD3 n=1 Tax=Eruca vesicaria subsp. sativa TaxID=29727 RepID=A0ABC8KBS1_ERUVS|nr:unnamed protein product [Eruca vesicaria subsp. sativa]